MTALTVHLPVSFEQWLELDDEGGRVELQNGALLVAPLHDHRHTFVVNQICAELGPQLTPGLVAVPGGNVRTDEDSGRIPDVLVLPRDYARRGDLYADARDVVLAVELLSRSTARTDRLVKTVEYAAAGIAHYWMVTVRPGEVVLEAHSLRGDAYVHVGTWTQDDRDVVLDLGSRVTVSPGDWLP